MSNDRKLYCVELTIRAEGEREQSGKYYVVAHSAQEAASVRSDREDVRFDVSRVEEMPDPVYEVGADGLPEPL